MLLLPSTAFKGKSTSEIEAGPSPFTRNPSKHEHTVEMSNVGEQKKNGEMEVEMMREVELR